MVDLAHISKKELGKLFDHSVLPKNACEREIREGCRTARAYNCAAFYSATSYWTPVVREELAGSDLLIGTGIDFPFGASPLPVKIAQMEEALRAGCNTLDLIINVGAVRDGRYDRDEGGAGRVQAHRREGRADQGHPGSVLPDG